MSTIWLVVKELAGFVIAELVRCFKQSDSNSTTLLPATPSAPMLESKLSPQPALVQIPVKALVITGEAWLVGVVAAAFYIRPVVLFDGVISWLAYGTPVAVLGYEGRFARVRWGDTIGYLLKDDLIAETDSLPVFVSGEVYLATTEATLRLRRLLNDEFNAATLALPLQPGELVSYCLWSKQLTLPWGKQRPRLPGEWHRLLRGAPRVHIGIEPVTGSIMEFSTETMTGLGYVRAVMPDQTVTVEMINPKLEGQYEVRDYPKDVWQDWRPVWISLT